MHQLVLLLLGPYLVWQGHHVRKVTPLLPEPEGAREGTNGEGAPLRLLVLGDSAAAGVGVPRQEQALTGQLVALLSTDFTVDWKLLAKTGDKTSDTLAALEQMEPQPFDIVVTSLGVNDVTGLVPRHKWLAQQKTLRTMLREKFGAKWLCISGLPPMRRFPALPQPLRWVLGSRALFFDKGIQKALKQEDDCLFLGLDFMDMDQSAVATDGFHPGPPVYKRWAEEAAPKIKERWQTTQHP